MSRHSRTALEVAIILLVAAAVEFIPGGHQTANAVYAAIIFAFGVAIFWVALRAYRERKMDLYALGDGRRWLFYGAIGVLIVTLAAQSRMWQTGLGEFAFWVIIGLSIYVLVAVVVYARRY